MLLQQRTFSVCVQSEFTAPYIWDAAHSGWSNAASASGNQRKAIATEPEGCREDEEVNFVAGVCM